MGDRQESTAPTEFPVLSENTRSPDTILEFYFRVLQSLQEAPLYLRRNVDSTSLCIRTNLGWQEFNRTRQQSFWSAAMQQHAELRKSNWSVRRLKEVWDYAMQYAPSATFDNRRYFETKNAVLDGVTGELITSDDRFLRAPTTRNSPLPYDPDYTPSPAWTYWYEGMDSHQRKVRDWSVGSAVSGQYGLLFTFGNTRVGKSTLAEGLKQALGAGTASVQLSQDWGRFGTQIFDNTTYLYVPDAKGAKHQHNKNYEVLHQMASGDPIQVEIKGAQTYETTNYGFFEVISNAPATLTFEPSLVDRVRFCLYTYIDPRSDGGDMKRRILADKQAWLNYAITCAIRLAKGEATRPKIDQYQAYGWSMWLHEANSYGRMCVDEGRLLSYSEYNYAYTGASYYKLTKETVETMAEGIKELNRQFGGDILKQDWAAYKEQLHKEYYAKATELL